MNANKIRVRAFNNMSSKLRKGSVMAEPQASVKAPAKQKVKTEEK